MKKYFVIMQILLLSIVFNVWNPQIEVDAVISPCPNGTNSMTDGSNNYTFTSTAACYAVNSYSDLEAIQTAVNAGNSLSGFTFIQKQDIDFADTNNDGTTTTTDVVTNWTPIGTATNPFSGYYFGYYGAQNSINNISIATNAIQNIGLFGYVNNATLSYISLVDVSITDSAIDSDIRISSIGGLIGQSDGTTSISNVNIQGLSITSSNYQSYIGGLLGSTGWSGTDSTTINQISMAGDLSILNSSSGDTTNHVMGGIVGYLINSSLSNSNITSANLILSSSVISSYGVGGLVGRMYQVNSGASPVLENSFIAAKGTTTEPYNFKIEGSRKVGGLIGWANGTIIKNLYLDVDKFSLTSTYSGNSERGGIWGNIGSSTNIQNIYFQFGQFDIRIPNYDVYVIGPRSAATYAGIYVAGNTVTLTDTNTSDNDPAGIFNSFDMNVGVSNSIISIRKLPDGFKLPNTNETYPGSLYYMDGNVLKELTTVTTVKDEQVTTNDLLTILNSTNTGYQLSTQGNGYYPVLSNIANSDIIQANQSDKPLYYDYSNPTFDTIVAQNVAINTADIDWSSSTYVKNITDTNNSILNEDLSSEVILTEVADSVTYDTLGTYTATIRATDLSGNYTEQMFNVTVVDPFAIEGAEYYNNMSFAASALRSEPDWLQGVYVTYLNDIYDSSSGTLSVDRYVKDDTTILNAIDMTENGSYDLVYKYSESGVVLASKTISVSVINHNIFLNNGYIKFGSNNETSFTNWGTLKQPFYFNSSAIEFYQLTHNNYPLDIIYGIGGDEGTTLWNNNGIKTSVNPVLIDLGYDLSNYVVYDGGTKANGTVIVKGVLALDTDTNTAGIETYLRVSNEYTIDSSSYLKVKTTLENINNAALDNLRFWIGTKDDQIYQDDTPDETRGNITQTSGTFEFVELSQKSDNSNAIEVTSENETVLFYSNEDNVATVFTDFNQIQFTVSGFDPTLTNISVSERDNQYALYLKFDGLDGNDDTLTSHSSSSMEWFYLAGSNTDIQSIINEAANDANNIVVGEEEASLDIENTSDGRGYYILVDYDATVPTEAQIEAGVSYSEVEVLSSGSELFTNSSAVSLAFENLIPETSYDVYYVPKTNSTYGTIIRISFKTLNDSTGPTFDTIADQIITEGQLDKDWSTLIQNTADNSGGGVTISEKVDNITYGTIGVYNVTVQATDPSNNTTTQTFTVTVVATPVQENISPSNITSIELKETHHIEVDLESIVIDLGSAFTSPDYTAYKLYGYFKTDLTNEVVVENNVDINQVGLYEIVFTLTSINDHENQTDTVTKTVLVNVIDTDAPVIHTEDSVEVLLEQLFNAVASCTDNSGECTLQYTGSVDTTTLGTYTITFMALDPSGNQSLKSQTVTVKVPEMVVKTVELEGQTFVFPLGEDEFNINDYTVEYLVSADGVDGTEDGWTIYANQQIPRSVDGEIIYIKVEDSNGNTFIKASTPYRTLKEQATDEPVLANIEDPVDEEEINYTPLIIGSLLALVMIAYFFWWFFILKDNDDEKEKEEPDYKKVRNDDFGDNYGENDNE